MMQWLKDNINHAITIPMLLSAGNFCLLLFKSLSDGVLTDAELHNLMQTSSGVNMIILCIALGILKMKNKD